MTQNVSTAVMQRRHEPTDSLDDFPTPPWATRAVINEVLMKRGVTFADKVVWEPACNRGYMARPLAEYFGQVITSDIADYGWAGQQAVGDFLGSRFTCTERGSRLAMRSPDWIFTNPPFNKAADFIHRALNVASEGVAIIVRGSFLEGGERYEELFSQAMPWMVAQHVERVPMNRGNYNPSNGTATAYTWLVWRRNWHEDYYLGTWVPKCRDRYERTDDVTYQTRTGIDWISQSIADSPLFASLNPGDA